MQVSKLPAAVLTIGSLLAFGLFAPPAWAQSYTLVELSQVESKAYAINNHSQIVGWIRADEDHHGFHWTSGELVDLQTTPHLSTLLVLTVPWSEGYDISDADQIVGAGRTAWKCPDATITVTTGFVMRPATNTDFGSPVPGDAVTDMGTFNSPCESPNSAVTGISNNYHVVGWADFGWPHWGRGGPHHAFLVQPAGGLYYNDANADFVNDLMVDLGSLGGPDSVSAASDVNDNGVVVGHAFTDGANASYHAFRWVSGATTGHALNPQMHDLGTLGGINSWARALNNNDQIVGEADTAQAQTHAFRWQNGAMTSLGTLGGTHSSAAAVNETGQIVGWAETGAGEKHAFLWDNGLMVDLNDSLPSGAILRLTEARDINGRGEIVGWGIDKSTEITRAFLIRLGSGDTTDTTDPDPAPSTNDTNTNTSNSPTDPPADDPLLSPDTVTPPATDVAGDSVDDEAIPPAPFPCGVGALGMLPFTLFGLCWMKLGTRRRRL